MEKQKQQQQQKQRLQQQPQPRKNKHARHSSHLPGAAPYLRILFPRHIQLREPVPQLLNHPHPDLDAEAYHFLALLVRDFIQTWYSAFSSDPQFVTAVVNVVISIARKLERRCKEVDWVGLLLQDVPEILKRHYMDYRQALQKHETAFAPNKTIEEIFHGLQPHFALNEGEESEKEYLRQLSDEILYILLPESEYESDCVRWLIREILCCIVLRSLVEILTEPDMVIYIVNTLLADFEPTDEKYESFLKKAADKIDTSDDKFKEFLASLSHSKGSPRGNQIHRSSTPNIQSTDEMVNMLQDAQSSILETKSSPNLNDRQQRQRNMKYPLSRSERPLNQHVSSRADPSTSKSISDSVPSNYVSSIEHPLQIPVDLKAESFARNRDTLLNGRPAQLGNFREDQKQRGARTDVSTISKVRSNIVWTITKAPPIYANFMINNILIPFGVMLIAFLNFMVNLPNRITQVSQSMFWIYAELDPPEHACLEAGILKLLEEIFYLEERNSVIWRQWQIIGWPLIRTLGGGAIDRLLAQGVYWIFAEPRLVFYIQAGRRALWPDPNTSPPRPRGMEEIQKARKEAERRLLRAIPAPLRDTFFGDNGVHHLVAAQEALEPLQNKICNKHLIYIALDLLLSKVIPEIYPERP